MGIFDEDLSPELRTTTTKKKTTSQKSSGMFDDFLTTDTVAPVTPETSVIPNNKKNVPAAYTQPAPTPTKELTFSDPGYYDSETFRNKITSAYDKAPDKQKYKNTLSNTELAVLNERRPDNKSYSNPTIYDATVKVKPMGFDDAQSKKIQAVNVIDKAIADKKLPENFQSWDDLVAGRNNTVKQIQSDNAKYYNTDGSQRGNVMEAFQSDTITTPDSFVQQAKNTA